MSSQIKAINLVLSVLVYQLTLTDSRKYSWNTQDAWLFPGRIQQGIHLTYSDTADWSDLWELMSNNGFYTAGSLCLKGVFIMYQEPLYIVPKPNAFEIVSGNLRCLVISENTRSIQLAGSVGHMYGPSITFFENPYFGSEGFSTVINVGSDFFNRLEYVRSAIIVGTVPWTLTLSTGKRICVLPEFDPTEKKPICLIKDFESLLGASSDDNNNDTEGENPTLFIKATQGCKKDEDEESIFRIQDCHYWGGPNKPKDVLVQFEDKDEIGGRSESDILCSGESASSKRIFKLYKAAITRNFDTELLVGLDMVGKHSWKLDLLDWIFTITTNVIPDDVIPVPFLNKVRELFVHKLVTAWNQNDTTVLTLTERNYKTLLRLSEECDNSITTDSMNEEGSVASKASLLASEFTNMWNNIQSVDDFHDLVSPDFKRNPSLDVITEMVWIIGHMAGFICHSHFMTTFHYWALYFNTFWHFYVLPVAPEWGKPTKGLSLFFGGVDYNIEYYKLAMFVGVTRKQAKNLEPLTRPRGVLPDDAKSAKDVEYDQLAAEIYDSVVDAELSSIPMAPSF